MSFTVVIPARYASQRLPGKPLLDIAGKPMIERVYIAAKRSLAAQVIVATDDQRIFDAVKNFGGEALMTSANHQSGTDRLQEVAVQLDLAPDSIVVNVQGDEPLIPAEVINQVAKNMSQNLQASAATLCEPITTVAELISPDNVKVVTDTSKMALYFSRSAIPWSRETYQKEMYCEKRGGRAAGAHGAAAYRYLCLPRRFT